MLHLHTHLLFCIPHTHTLNTTVENCVKNKTKHETAYIRRQSILTHKHALGHAHVNALKEDDKQRIGLVWMFKTLNSLRCGRWDVDKLRQAEREGGGVGLTAAIRSIKQTEPKKKKKKTHYKRLMHGNYLPQ